MLSRFNEPKKYPPNKLICCFSFQSGYGSSLSTLGTSWFASSMSFYSNILFIFFKQILIIQVKWFWHESLCYYLFKNAHCLSVSSKPFYGCSFFRLGRPKTVLKRAIHLSNIGLFVITKWNCGKENSNIKFDVWIVRMMTRSYFYQKYPLQNGSLPTKTFKEN